MLSAGPRPSRERRLRTLSTISTVLPSFRLGARVWSPVVPGTARNKNADPPVASLTPCRSTRLISITGPKVRSPDGSSWEMARGRLLEGHGRDATPEVWVTRIILNAPPLSPPASNSTSAAVAHFSDACATRSRRHGESRPIEESGADDER